VCAKLTGLRVGLDDLEAGLVRTPLEPVQTLTDDPLRGLRAIRFAARFGFVLEAALQVYMKQSEFKVRVAGDLLIGSGRVAAQSESRTNWNRTAVNAARR
jgi:hypothetical protein